MGAETALGLLQKLEKNRTAGQKKNFTRYFADEYGYVRGVRNMKKEIWKRGPIGCGVDATAKFDKYSGGIFSQRKKHPQINHEISVVGWGKDPETGEEYWIGKTHGVLTGENMDSSELPCTSII